MANLEQILKLQKLTDKELLQLFESCNEHTFEQCCEIGRRVEMADKIATSHGDDFDLAVNEAVEKLKKQIEDKERYEIYKETYMPLSMAIQEATDRSVIDSMLGIRLLNNDELLKVYAYYEEYTQRLEKKTKEDTEHKEVLEKIYNLSLNNLNEIAEEIKKEDK